MEISQKTSNNNSQQMNKDTSETNIFDELVDLQALLKKESALKELFIKTCKETQKNIEDLCVEIYKKKMEVLNVKQRVKNSSFDNNLKKEQQQFQEHSLVKNNYDYLEELNTYIPKLMKYIWEDPKLTAKILLYSDEEDTKKYIAPLICNNFYENILSSNYIEDHLMYVMYLLLDEEINKLKSIDNANSFLSKTPLRFLLNELKNKKDVKNYFNIILKNIIQEIGVSSLNFNVSKIELNQKNIKTKKNINEFEVYAKKDVVFDDDDISTRSSIQQFKLDSFCENSLSSKTLSPDFDYTDSDSDKVINYKISENFQIFNSKYIPDLSVQEIKNLREENINDTKMKDYFDYLLNGKGDNYVFSNSNFIDSVFKTKISTMILAIYQQDFMKAINFIEKLLINFLSNVRLIPYSIRCVCKMIAILLKKKFPDINSAQIFLFISKFFFENLFIEILKNPDKGALINDYIISKSALNNLNIIAKILLQFASFQLFTNANSLRSGNNFTPFNRFFLDNIHNLLDFFDSLTKVKLPSFIEQLVNGKISKETYEFDYFKENPNEVLFHRSMCLTIDDVNAILKSLNKNKKKIFISDNTSNLYKTFERIYDNTDNMNLLNKLLKHDDYKINNKEKVTSKGLFGRKKSVVQEKTQIIYYFLINDLICSENYNQNFTHEQKKPYFQIKEIKDLKDKDIIAKNNIIKTKNLMSSILYNYQILVKTDFNEGTTDKMEDIFKELQLFMKSTNFVIDGDIPSEWYVSSLLEHLKRLPNDYINDEYKKLLSELKEEVINSIKNYKFEEMSICMDKMKYAIRNKNYYCKLKEILIDIELNKKANKIIENDVLNINLFYKFNTQKKEFCIFQEKEADKQLGFLDSWVFKENQKAKCCRTIHSFTKYFPNLNKYCSNHTELDIFELQKEIELPQKLKTFFDIINNYLIKNEKISTNKELEIINNKIYDYVISNIYDRIFPTEGHYIYTDEDIYRKTLMLSWAQPNHFISNKNQYDFDLVLPDIIKDFQFIYTERSPRKKFMHVSNIFSLINRLLVFNSEAIFIGVDDQMPLLNYVFIKANPVGIYTNCKFMELYIGEKKNKGEDNQLSQLLSICEFVKDINDKSLFNVTEEEFNYNCNKCLDEYKKLDNFYERKRIYNL